MFGNELGIHIWICMKRYMDKYDKVKKLLNIFFIEEKFDLQS